MRLKSIVIAVCSLGLLSSVAVAQDQAPTDKEGQTKMSMPTGGKMKMTKHRKHRKMMHKKMM